jgi:class I fructose-bisphosphate aldolase
MRVTQRVKKLLSLYESDNPGTKTNLARILMEGRLSGSGRVVILPIEGSTRNFYDHPAGHDPQYHFQLAVDAGLSALAAPLGMLESAADTFAGSIPLILKLNALNVFSSRNGKSGHGIIGSVRDALRLGCVGIGCTLQSGADAQTTNLEEIRSIVEEAKSYGLAVVLWSSPGGHSDQDETALDNTAYAGHMASLMGAHMICVRVPGSHLHQTETTVENIRRPVMATLSDRVRHVRQSCLNGRRIVLFEGNQLETDEDVFEDIRGIRDGGGHGYILPYNSLHRQFEPALQMLDQSLRIYQGKA